jgi:hypothetical protein
VGLTSAFAKQKDYTLWCGRVTCRLCYRNSFCLFHRLHFPPASDSCSWRNMAESWNTIAAGADSGLSFWSPYQSPPPGHPVMERGHPSRRRACRLPRRLWSPPERRDVVYACLQVELEPAIGLKQGRWQFLNQTCDRRGRQPTRGWGGWSAGPGSSLLLGGCILRAADRR